MTLQWPVASLLPHSRTMVMISEPADCGDGWAEASVRIGEDSLFFRPGEGVPSWVGSEYMAQTVALYAGIRAKQAGKEIQIGLLIGCRRYEIESDYFRLGSHLRVRAENIWEDNQMAVFQCSIADPKLLAKVQLNVFSPNDVASFLESEQS